jgi:hypothetical protein
MAGAKPAAGGEISVGCCTDELPLSVGTDWTVFEVEGRGIPGVIVTVTTLAVGRESPLWPWVSLAWTLTWSVVLGDGVG